MKKVIWIGSAAERPRKRSLLSLALTPSTETGLADRLMACGVEVVLAIAPEEVAATADIHVVRVARDTEASVASITKLRIASPVLWLADDEELELLSLGEAKPEDAVVRTPDDVRILSMQIDRLLERSHSGDVPQSRDMDGLTGLPNRRAFGRILRSAIADRLPGDHKALVQFDLDDFKGVNDAYGHTVGDQVLKAVADRLAGGIGPEDHVCRLGGDEFAALISRYDAPSLVRDADRMLKEIAKPLTLSGGREVAIQASAGLATLRLGMTEPQLLRQVDSAAYEAKAQGRGRLIHFELIHDGKEDGPEADLKRFTEVTRMFSDRMSRMVGDMGRQLVEAARVQALQDPLTGARNRGFFKERLPREIERARAGSCPLAMALLDIDNFHDVNLTYGWPSGDAVLQRFVEVASANIRAIDWLARYGGEEFAVVLPDTDLDLANTVLERLRQAVSAAEFTALDGRRIPITISVGVAALAPDVLDAVALANQASQACLLAKGSGKNRVCIQR